MANVLSNGVYQDVKARLPGSTRANTFFAAPFFIDRTRAEVRNDPGVLLARDPHHVEASEWISARTFRADSGDMNGK